MTESKNGKLFAIIAAILFIGIGIYGIIISRKMVIEIEYYTIRWQTVAWWFFYISMGVLLLIRKKHIGLLIPPAIAALLSVLNLIAYFRFETLFTCVAWILLFVVFLLNVIPGMNAGATKILCFLPGGIYLIGDLIIWIQFGYFSDIGSGTGRVMILTIIRVAAMVLAGLWLKETMYVVEPSVNKNQYSTFNPQSTMPQQNNLIGGADKIKMYKDLLDSGVISQEEFNLKKREILEF